MGGAERDVSVGVDVGGTTTRVAVFDRDGDLVRIATAPTPRGGTALVEHVSTTIVSEVAAAGGRLVCVGVGIPGGVRDGTVTMALNVGIDGPLALASLLGSRLGAPVRIENDVNAAALGASVHLGIASGSGLAYLSLGTGFAAGVVIAGSIVRGASGTAGEIGHVPLPGRTTRCVCGQVGCLETIVSGRAMTERLAGTGLDGGATGLWRAADAGHAAATAIRDDVVSVLAWSCQLVCVLVDVELIVIGGGVGAALGERLIDPIRAALTETGHGSAFVASLRLADRVVAAPPGIELGALGADRAARAAREAGWP